MLQGNHVHVLGESISFGRFTSESLSCENWSGVPQKRYVEEAKSFTQPGSVAQKKAFFEAHYKKIAAQKAAAAALLEQEKAEAASRQLTDANKNIEDHVNVSVDSGTSQSRRPLLKPKLNTDEEVTKPMIKRKPAVSPLVSSIGRKPYRIPPPPAKFVASVNHRKDHITTPRTKNLTTKEHIDKRRSAPKSLKALMNSRFVKEPKIQSTKPPASVRTTPKRGATPMKTPAKAYVNEVNKQPLETSVNPKVAGSKSTGPKWHILSAVPLYRKSGICVNSSKSLSAYRNKMKSPTISSPFVLRTEDRAARRKQKLEEKFNEKEAGQVQQETKLKDKAETEFRRLHQSFCFKARPLPNFYKEIETPQNQMKTPEANLMTFTPRRKTPSSVKKKSTRRLWKYND
ncbi:WVD2-like protein 7 isoform X1 [Tanacetum coccineum]